MAAWSPVPARSAAALVAASGDDIAALRDAARACRACPLWQLGRQTVFGEGPDDARIVLVGEQPGDVEDSRGRPFVGPAGRLLDRALTQAGIDRAQTYLTNAVKHFKWEPRGKRRIHKTPAQKEIDACNQWLQAEIALVKPALVVCLGVTAGRALLGHAIRIGVLRGELHEAPAHPGMRVALTYHPAFVLRQRDAERFAVAYAELVEDLRAAVRMLHLSERKPS